MLSADYLTATQGNNYNNYVALVEPAIEGKRRLRGKRSIRFLIAKPSSWLSVGAAYARPIQRANFELETSNTGHGAYVISFQGYSFHSDSSEMNSYYHSSFSFKEGDIVRVTVHASSERILFEK